MALSVTEIIDIQRDKDDASGIPTITFRTAMDSRAFGDLIKNPERLADFVDIMYNVFDQELKVYVLKQLLLHNKYIVFVLEHITDWDDKIFAWFKDNKIYIKSYYHKLSDAHKNDLWVSDTINPTWTNHDMRLEKTGFIPSVESAQKAFDYVVNNMNTWKNKVGDNVDLVAFFSKLFKYGAKPTNGMWHVFYDINLARLFLKNGYDLEDYRQVLDRSIEEGDNEDVKLYEELYVWFSTLDRKP